MNGLFVCFITMLSMAIHYTNGAMDTEKWMEIGKQCKEDTNAGDNDVKDLLDKKVPETSEGKCLLACIFKKSGVFTEDGKFDEEANNKMIDEDFSDDPEKQDQFRKLSDACKDDVNAVEDDESGCERAAVMTQCTMDKAKELGYKDE